MAGLAPALMPYKGYNKICILLFFAASLHIRKILPLVYKSTDSAWVPFGGKWRCFRFVISALPLSLLLGFEL